MVTPFFFMQAWKAAMVSDEVFLELPPPQPAVTRTAPVTAARPSSRACLKLWNTELS